MNNPGHPLYERRSSRLKLGTARKPLHKNRTFQSVNASHANEKKTMITSFRQTNIGSTAVKAILFERDSPPPALKKFERFWSITLVMFCLLTASTGNAMAEQLKSDGVHHSKITSAVKLLLDKEAAEIRKTIPKRVDLITKLVDVRVEGETFVYGMEVDDALSDAELEVLRRRAPSAISRAACQDGEIRYLVSSGANVAWIYSHKGLVLLKVTVSSCPR